MARSSAEEDEEIAQSPESGMRTLQLGADGEPFLLDSGQCIGGLVAHAREFACFDGSFWKARQPGRRRPCAMTPDSFSIRASRASRRFRRAPERCDARRRPCVHRCGSLSRPRARNLRSSAIEFAREDQARYRPCPLERLHSAPATSHRRSHTLRLGSVVADQDHRALLVFDRLHQAVRRRCRGDWSARSRMRM